MDTKKWSKPRWVRIVRWLIASFLFGMVVDFVVAVEENHLVHGLREDSALLAAGLSVGLCAIAGHILSRIWSGIEHLNRKSRIRSLARNKNQSLRKKLLEKKRTEYEEKIIGWMRYSEAPWSLDISWSNQFVEMFFSPPPTAREVRNTILELEDVEQALKSAP